MHLEMPVSVWDEDQCVKMHAADLARLGTKALLVTGRHSAKACGALDDVTDALSQHRISWTLFNEIEENPSVETILSAREKGLADGADFVIGIGGGSAMDAAKAIALLMRHPEEDGAALYDSESPSDALPVAAVPTTCGTGSEVTPVAVLTRHDKETKQSISHRIFPALALIDGRYLESAPLSLIRNTAVDAIAHLFESAVNAKSTPLSRMFVDAGLREWAKNRAFLVSGDHELASWSGLMRASAMAGMAIAQTGTSLPHGFSYPITYRIHMAHGRACGYFEAGYLREASAGLRDELLTLAGFRSLDDWQSFYRTVCGPDPLPDEELEHAVDVLAGNPAKLAAAPFAVDRETLHRIAFFGRK